MREGEGREGKKKKMERLSDCFYRGGKAYSWRSRNYERLNRPTRRRKLAVVQLGRPGGSKRGRPFFRPVLKANTNLSPKRFLIRLRNAYVNFMTRLANGIPAIGGGYDGVIVGSFVGFGKDPLKEHDEEMIAKIYETGRFTGPHNDKMIARIYGSGLPKYRKEKIYRSLVVGGDNWFRH